MGNLAIFYLIYLFTLENKSHGRLGDRPHIWKNELDDQSYFTIQQFEDYGFLELKVTNNGKNLVGKFYANDGLIEDNFIIEKSVDKNFDDEKIPNNGVPNLNGIS